MAELDDFLKGIKPEENDSFEVLNGTYEAAINSLTVAKRRDSDEEQYMLELNITEVIDGNGNAGRKLWNRYAKTEEGLKRLVNELFTAGIELDRSQGISGFESQFQDLGGKKLYVRAWGWTPKEDRSGNPIPEAEQRTFQQLAVVSEKRLKKLLEKRAVEQPF